MSSPMWSIIQDWHDAHRVKPSWAKVAKELGVSQSTFDTWKQPSEMPRRRNLWAIHELTRVPFKTVVDAAIESVDLYNSKRAREAHEEYRLKKESDPHGSQASTQKNDEVAQRRAEREDRQPLPDLEETDPSAPTTPAHIAARKIPPPSKDDPSRRPDIGEESQDDGGMEPS